MSSQGKAGAHDGKLHIGGCKFGAVVVDILYPSMMIVETIGRNADHFDTSLLKVLGTASDFTELCCANWGEITGMGKENGLWKGRGGVSHMS